MGPESYGWQVNFGTATPDGINAIDWLKDNGFLSPAPDQVIRWEDPWVHEITLEKVSTVPVYIPHLPKIEKVIFNKLATIVFWEDGTKTVVKCSNNDWYDPEKGLAMCMAKKIFGNKGRYYNEFRKWLKPEGYYDKDANIDMLLKDSKELKA